LTGKERKEKKNFVEAKGKEVFEKTIKPKTKQRNLTEIPPTNQKMGTVVPVQRNRGGGGMVNRKGGQWMSGRGERRKTREGAKAGICREEKRV